MLDSALQPAFDGEARIAYWVTVSVALTAVVLFVYTLGLRAATQIEARRQRAVQTRWRQIFARAMMSRREAEELELPRIRRRERTELLEAWNRARDAVEGIAADNLVVLGWRTGLGEYARQLLKRRRLSAQLLALQTLGHLRDTDSWDAIRDLAHSPNTAVAATAAAALTDIDDARAIETLMPLIATRDDWPRTKVSMMLRKMDTAALSTALCAAVVSAADDRTRVHLLQFAALADAGDIDRLAARLLTESDHPGVLGAALKLISGYNGIPRIGELTSHPVFFVRMHAAAALGRAGEREHLHLLEDLLADSEWWVRYRSAQAIVSQPFLGPNALRQLRDRQHDRYARDMMTQGMAEVGLA